MSKNYDRMFQEPMSSHRHDESILFDDGLKVVRGPNWTWNNEDDGEGHVGTVVGKIVCPSGKLLTVQWDYGLRNNYRIGANGFYDLRALDNASLGVVHSTTTCDSCEKVGIIGMRWKCKWCYDYDLCSRCYMSDKHNVTHPFQRIQVDNGPIVDVPERTLSQKIQLRGIFPPAQVVRSTDWDWHNQDGGSGKTGTVIKVHGWVGDYNTNSCTVLWSATNLRKRYRIGYDGKMDLQYVREAAGGYYYRDHLPIVGNEWKPISVATQKNSVYEISNEWKPISVATQKNSVYEISNEWKPISVATQKNSVYEISNEWKPISVATQKNSVYEIKSAVSKQEAERPEQRTIKGVEKEKKKPRGDEWKPISVVTQKNAVSEKKTDVSKLETERTEKKRVKGGEEEKKKPRESDLIKLEAEHTEEKSVKGGEEEKKKPRGLGLLSQNLECLYQTSQFCDFSLKVKTREYKVHRAILGARSPVFASMLQHDMKEKNSGAAVISDCDPESFEAFLFYIYSGKSERLSKKNAIELYKAAEKYDVLKLKDDCITFLKKNLSVDIICDVLSLAVTFGDSKLIEYCTNYFVSNAEDIILSVQWLNFLTENPTIANELYLKALTKKP